MAVQKFLGKADILFVKAGFDMSFQLTIFRENTEKNPVILKKTSSRNYERPE
jgi:hypothetical protein